MNRFVRKEAVLRITLGTRTARQGSSSSGGGGGGVKVAADGSTVPMVDRQHLSGVLEYVS